jgi:hypothetical protein
VETSARTIKECVPPGVDELVWIVRVVLLVFSLPANEIDAGENVATAPPGSAEAESDTVMAPFEPWPDPRFTVTV